MKYQIMYENLCNQPVNEGFKKKLATGALAGALALGSLTGKASPTNKLKQEISSPIDKNKDISSNTKERIMLNLAKRYIGKHEGERKEIYKDSKGKDTIGIGHLIKPGEDFSGGIDDKEMQKLFDKDIQERLSVTKNLFPNFNSYPPYVQVTLLDGVYRGDLSGSPKTIKLINNDMWIEAAEEYLNNNEYRTSKAQSGIRKRMKKNSERMKYYGENK